MHRLVLRDLRKLVEETKDAPDDLPVVVLFPVSFFDEDDSHLDPETIGTPSEVEAIGACAVTLETYADGETVIEIVTNHEEFKGSSLYWE